MDIKETLDLKDDSPQVVKLGRLHHVTVECFVPENATPEQIEEYISGELGWGGIGPDNPLYHGGLQVREVTHERDTGLNGYTLWNAVGDDAKPGHRTGSTILRKPGEPWNVIYSPPAAGEGRN